MIDHKIGDVVTGDEAVRLFEAGAVLGSPNGFGVECSWRANHVAPGQYEVSSNGSDWRPAAIDRDIIGVDTWTIRRLPVAGDADPTQAAPGVVCDHGSLKRKCLTCEYEHEIETLRREGDVLETERDDARAKHARVREESDSLRAQLADVLAERDAMQSIATQTEREHAKMIVPGIRYSAEDSTLRLWWSYENDYLEITAVCAQPPEWFARDTSAGITASGDVLLQCGEFSDSLRDELLKRTERQESDKLRVQLATVTAERDALKVQIEGSFGGVMGRQACDRAACVGCGTTHSERSPCPECGRVLCQRCAEAPSLLGYASCCDMPAKATP